MTDIVEKLRRPWFTHSSAELHEEAAAEIERLRVPTPSASGEAIEALAFMRGAYENAIGEEGDVAFPAAFDTVLAALSPPATCDAEKEALREALRSSQQFVSSASGGQARNLTARIDALLAKQPGEVG